MTQEHRQIGQVGVQGVPAPREVALGAEFVVPTGTGEDTIVIPFKDAFKVAVAAGLGYGFDAYAVNIYGLILPYLVVSLHTNLKTLGNIGSLQLIGYTIGTIGFGWAADRWGRKDTMGVSILTYGITTALGGLFTTVAPFAAMRFLTGVGGAGELAVGAPYTTEMWPKKHRALGTGGIIFSIYSLGFIVAGLVALFVVGNIGWQYAFYIAIIPALIVFFIRRKIQESPRYKLSVALAKARKEALDQGGEAEGQSDGVTDQPALEHIWSTAKSRKRVVLGSLIYIANAVGYWALAVFLTTFIVKRFHQTPHTAIFWAIIFYVVQFFLSYAGTLLADWIGRRPAAIIGSIIMIVSTVLAAEAGTFDTFLVFMCITIGMLGWLWGIGNTYISELFPTHLRGTGFGWCVGIGRIASIFAPTLVAAGIVAIGVKGTLLLTAPLWILGIIGYGLGPETSGVELEEAAA